MEQENPSAPAQGAGETRATGSFDMRDELTGVRGYYTLLNNAADYMGDDVYVMLCDLDNFRMVNDAYGENYGNVLLATVGKTIQRSFGDSHVFRYGSDEFLVVNEFFDEDAFLEKIDNLDRRIDAIGEEGKPVHLTLSYGYSHGKLANLDDLHEAIRFADRKMYEAKRLGKARAVGSSLDGDSLMAGGHRHDATRKSYEIDELTGLANLMFFRNSLSTKLAANNVEDLPEGERPAIVFFNIENFKAYNQKYGFDAGDELLLLVGDAIREAFPDRLAARVSADQFMVSALAQDVEKPVEAVRGTFRKKHKDSSIMLKAGAYVIEPDDTDVGLVCDRPKMACDSIKGRRDVFFRHYDKELQHDILMHRYVLDNFDRALREGWIRVYYQPIVRVATGEICEEECLARWVDPKRGVIPPIDFIPVLEEARLIHKLDLYIVRRACENLIRGNYDPARVAPMSINLSRLDFELCDALAEVEAILAEYDIPRELFSIEVTENALTGNAQFLKGEIDRFREEGFEVWMDDFGSGYSSLNLLKEYNFDVVKIDMGFLRGFENGDESRVLLANVINLAKELGLHTLVEGVETEEQLHFLKSIGCGRAQGYYFGRPIPFDEVMQMRAADNAGQGKGNLHIELNAKRDFFAKIGDVNLMRPDPIRSADGRFIPGDIPAAVVVRTNGVYQYLNVSDAYSVYLQHIGMGDEIQAAARLNDPLRPEHIRMEETLARCLQSRDWEWMTTFNNGIYCALRVRIVDDLPEFDMVAATVIAVNVQESSMLALA